MAAHFILLELLDPTVNSFLWKVREILGWKRSNSPIHLTIRGPYSERQKEPLQQARETLRQDVLEISGVGRFSNKEDEVVYFGVNSPNLRVVWWKPDYPIEKYGFTPHISVYRGHDAGFAKEVTQFLSGEHIKLLCAEHQVVWHQSRQPSLLTHRVPTLGDMIEMDSSNRVDVTVLDRLESLRDNYFQRNREHYA